MCTYRIASRHFLLAEEVFVSISFITWIPETKHDAVKCRNSKHFHCFPGWCAFSIRLLFTLMSTWKTTRGEHLSKVTSANLHLCTRSKRCVFLNLSSKGFVIQENCIFSENTYASENSEHSILRVPSGVFCLRTTRMIWKMWTSRREGHILCPAGKQQKLQWLSGDIKWWCMSTRRTERRGNTWHAHSSCHDEIINESFVQHLGITKPFTSDESLDIWRSISADVPPILPCKLSYLRKLLLRLDISSSILMICFREAVYLETWVLEECRCRPPTQY